MQPQALSSLSMVSLPAICRDHQKLLQPANHQHRYCGLKKFLLVPAKACMPAWPDLPASLYLPACPGTWSSSNSSFTVTTDNPALLQAITVKQFDNGLVTLSSAGSFETHGVIRAIVSTEGPASLQVGGGTFA